MTSLGAAIRHRRLELGLSLGQLSAAAGVSETHIHQVEKGIRGLGPTRLRKLANALALDPYALDPTIDQQEARNAARRAGAATARTHARLIECIAAHIETALAARRWTWKDLRLAAHISTDTQVELKNRLRLPSRATVERIASALNLTVAHLTDGEWVQDDGQFRAIAALQDAILAYDPAATVLVEREDPSPWKTSDYWLAILLNDGAIVFARGKQDWADYLTQCGDLTRLSLGLAALAAVPDPPARRPRPAGVVPPSRFSPRERSLS